MSEPDSAIKVYCEGTLLKRQRGRGRYPLFITLRFQERFCRLTQTSLEYYNTKGKDFKPGPDDLPNGSFAVDNIKIVETVLQEVFRRDFCFQVGNQDEVMYFAVFSNEERDKWIEGFRQVAKNNDNRMLEDYHTGLFTYFSWSCCKSSYRTSIGCQKTSTFVPSQLPPIIETIDEGQSPQCQPGATGSAASGTAVGSASTLQLSPHNLAKRLIDHDMKNSAPQRRVSDDSGIDEPGSLDSSLSYRKGSPHPLPSSLVVSNTKPPSDTMPSPDLTSPFHSHSVTALAFHNANTLVSGSTMSSVQIWDIPALTFENTIRTTDATSSLNMWGDFLAIGSDFVQIVDMNDTKSNKLFIADDQPLQTPPMQLVAFGPRGHLATVNSESKIVKVWPPPSQTKEFITKPTWSSGSTLDHIEGSLYGLAMSSNEEQPWIAVGEVPEEKEEGCVHLLNWKEEEQFHFVLFPGVRNGILCIAFSHSGQNIAAGCDNLTIWEVNSRTIISAVPIANYTSENEAVCSLCYSPDDAHLAAGTSTGKVVIYKSGDSSPLFILEGPDESNTPATAVAFSNDGSFFAAGYYSGKIRLWENMSCYTIVKETHLGSQSVHNLTKCIPLIGRVEDEIQSREEEYITEFLDYKIVVPANATREGRKIPFQTGEMPLGPVGPFKFPPNTKPVSSIVWFHSNGMSDLQKPIKIVLSHCLNCTSDDDLKQLVFMKAGDGDFKIDLNGEKEFVFHELREGEKEEEPIFTSFDGILTTQHCCWYCIFQNVDRDEIENARYCLTEAVSRQATDGKYEIRFILHYYLLPCMKTINEQYGRTHNLNRYPVTFSDRGPNPSIQIGFESSNLPEGWTLLRRSAQNIPVKKVHFQGVYRTQKELALDVCLHGYPPSVLLLASGRQATGDTVVSIKIAGADEELEVDILLEKPNQDPTPELGSVSPEAAAAVIVEDGIPGRDVDDQPWQSMYHASGSSQQQHSPTASAIGNQHNGSQ